MTTLRVTLRTTLRTALRTALLATAALVALLLLLLAARGPPPPPVAEPFFATSDSLCEHSQKGVAAMRQAYTLLSREWRNTLSIMEQRTQSQKTEGFVSGSGSESESESGAASCECKHSTSGACVAKQGGVCPSGTIENCECLQNSGGACAAKQGGVCPVGTTEKCECKHNTKDVCVAKQDDVCPAGTTYVCDLRAQAVNAAKEKVYASYNLAAKKINANIEQINEKFIKAKRDEAEQNRKSSESLDKIS